jgi:hypothetical protein
MVSADGKEKRHITKSFASAGLDAKRPSSSRSLFSFLSQLNFYYLASEHILYFSFSIGLSSPGATFIKYPTDRKALTLHTIFPTASMLLRFLVFTGQRLYICRNWT